MNLLIHIFILSVSILAAYGGKILFENKFQVRNVVYPYSISHQCFKPNLLEKWEEN